MIVADETEIANKFNNYFIEKVANLKESIDKERVVEPLDTLKEKMKKKNLKFTLKTVSEKTVNKVMKEMRKKKSVGHDNISQECLLLGKNVLTIPLTRIINASIKDGKVPETWKEAVVTPILKKGEKDEIKNYRPVSCLVTASKILEKIVCLQITEFIEKNNLLPKNQHGFRARRSTMTAHTNMQSDWTKNTEAGEKTGILIWDLSPAFDTLDIGLLLKKLEIYGFNELTCSWFKSFLTQRTQKVKIGNALSDARTLESGVPQGGILSPIVFTLFTADLEDWLIYTKLFGYADDVTTSVAGKNIEEMLKNLKVDCESIWVTRTAFMFWTGNVFASFNVASIYC